MSENDDLYTSLKNAQTNSDQHESVSSETSQPWSPDLVTSLSVSVLVFTTITLVLCTTLLWRARSNAIQVLRIFGILSIIGLSAFLLIVAYSKEQLTPIVGLFGAIAGYLLGKESTSNSDSTRREDSKT